MQKNKDGKWIEIGRTKEINFTAEFLTPNTDYSFGVISMAQGADGKLYESWISTEIKVKTQGVLDAPKVEVGNDASSGKPKLVWTKVYNADKYEVYQSSSKDGDYQLMTTTTKTSYTNTLAKPGKKYYYKVKALSAKSDRVDSEYSNIVVRTCDLERPVVTASNDSKTGKVKLSWKKISGAEKYKIYRAASKNGTYKYVNTISGTSYTNKAAEAGKTYYYKVIAVDTDNSAANSAYSLIDKRTCDLARPVVTASNDSKTGKVKLRWKKISGAEKYKIYRATSKNGTYSYVNTVSGTSYIHKAAKKGKIYYYKLKAVDTGNNQANSSYSLVVARKCK